MPRRRALLGLGAAGLLAGCGFRPLHGPGGDLDPELAAVRVAPIPERGGQLLRRHLQRRLEASRPGTPARYLLTVAPSFEFEALGFRADGTVTRTRALARGNWVLTTETTPPEVIDRGVARTLDAFNIPDLQFFAAEASREAMDRRLVEELGDRIAEAVAVSLRRRRAA